MKSTLKDTVGNVYQINNNGEFSSKTKKLVKNANTSGNSNLMSSMNGPKKNSNLIEPKLNSNMVGISNIQKSSFSILNFIAILLIILVVMMITIVFVFKDKVVEYIKSYIMGPTKNEEGKSNVNDLKNRISELEQKNKMMQAQKQKQVQTKKVDSKNFESYDPKQQVKSDGYCYIGYDNGMRECAPVYQGDICISGEQFPRLDKCMVPKIIA